MAEKGTIPQNITAGTPNTAEAPGGLRRFFRFSQLAVGDAGKTRRIEDIWATLLQELNDLGIPPEARSRIESLGAKKILGSGGRLPESVVKLAGNKENVNAIKETVKAASSATKGLRGAPLISQWKKLLKQFAGDPQFQTPEGQRILQELQDVDPKLVARVGSNKTLSALAERGDDPTVVRLFNRVMNRPGSGKLPEGIQETLKAANEGRLPKVAAAEKATLRQAGAKGLGAGRKAAGLLGKSTLGTLGIGAVAALEAKRAFGVLGRENKAKQLALQGFQGLGPQTSVDFLRDIVSKQEAIARRKVTMQRFEPDLFQEVVRILADTGQSTNTLTSTERRIGTDSQTGAVNRGRSSEDVQFLLDQLFSQMGNGPTGQPPGIPGR